MNTKTEGRRNLKASDSHVKEATGYFILLNLSGMETISLLLKVPWYVLPDLGNMDALNLNSLSGPPITLQFAAMPDISFNSCQN